MKTDFTFKGLMVPVFTPFHDDKKLTINYEMIDKYAHFLKAKGMHGVMVNGMTGEGMTLTLDERKKLAEKWFEVTRKYDLKMLLNIGGISITETYELAEHAERLKVDAVMLMPDLFYKPITEVDLVKYIKDIVMYMPTRPVFYYHIPFLTNVHMDFYHFLDLVEKEIKLFAGIFYADDGLSKIMSLREKKPDYLYIVGLGTSMMGYMAEGFDAISMTAFNIYPEMMKELFDLMKDYKMREAYMLKEKMVKRVIDMFRMEIDTDFLTLMKMEMDKVITTLKMGPLRKPKMSMRKMIMWMGRM